MIATRVTTILAIALIGVLVNSAAAVVSQAYAAGGLMQLVPHSSQDVYSRHYYMPLKAQTLLSSLVMMRQKGNVITSGSGDRS